MAYKREYGYAWEKLYGAVLGLAQGDRPSWERLRDAYVFHIMNIGPENTPPDIAEDLQKLKDALRRVKATDDQGDAMASARALDELEVHDLIGSIVAMYDRVTKYGPNREGD